jgi:Tubulin-tyrosine ligase family
MNPNRRKHCFELFGFDFLLDEDFRVWLIEINTNPYLGTPNKDMVVLVPKMINEMCALVLDVHLKPEIEPNIEKSEFQLIYREETNGNTYVNHRRPFNLDLCYPIIKLKPFIGKPEKKIAKTKFYKDLSLKQSAKHTLNEK